MSLFDSPSDSLFLCLCSSAADFLSVCLSVPLSVCTPVSLVRSLSLSSHNFPVFLCLSLTFVSFSLSLFVCVSLCLCLCVSVLSLHLYLLMCPSVRLSTSALVCLRLDICLSALCKSLSFSFLKAPSTPISLYGLNRPLSCFVTESTPVRGKRGLQKCEFIKESRVVCRLLAEVCCAKPFTRPV